MNYQKIILVGNTTDAVKLQQPKGKMAYADFTVAVNRSREEADFFPVRAFGKLAENIAQLEKGAQVLVEGRLELGQFVPEEGEPRKTVRIIASVVLAI